MDSSTRPTFFDVDSYPILRDICSGTGTVPHRPATCAHSDGHPVNSGHQVGGFAPPDHSLCAFPVQGQWGYWTYQYIPLCVGGEMGWYPQWRYESPSLERLPTSEAIFAEEPRPSFYDAMPEFPEQAYEDGDASAGEDVLTDSEDGYSEEPSDMEDIDEQNLNLEPSPVQRFWRPWTDE